jgi:hypothetical protein
MAAPRLLVEIEVLDFLRTLPQREQAELVKRFRAIAAYPANHSDYTEEAFGRRVDVHVFRKFAIKYWNDAADGHIKILDMHPADRRAT